MPLRTGYWNKEFDRLSSKTDDEIYRELSLKVQVRKLRPGKAYAVRADPAHGRSWLAHKLSEVKDRICKNAKLRRLVLDGDYTQRDLFLVLVDILSGLAFYIPVGTVAKILCRRGLKDLCKDLSKVPRRKKRGTKKRN